MKNYLLLLALAAPLVFGSCSKDDDEDAPAPAPATPPTAVIENPFSGFQQGSTDPAVMQFTKDMLTGTTWELSALVQAPENSVNVRNVYKSLPSCQRDDIYTFNTTGNGLTITDGLDWCNSSAQTKNGSWTMATSSKLTITAAGLTQGGLTGEFSIVQLSEETLVLQQKANGFVYVATYEKHVPSTEELLMNKNWRLTAQMGYYFGNSQDMYSNLQACQQDNLINFSGSGQLTMDEGLTKCDPSDPQTISTPYSFYGSSIYINSQQYYIGEITDNKLVLINYDYSQGMQMQIISTYAKQ